MKLNKVAENIGAMSTPSVGIAGEVRCVVTGADGTVKTDTGYQKNLILNQGLDFFGGGKGSYINASCAIGSGNSAPAITQTGLDAYIAQAAGTYVTSDYSYVDKGDNLYRMWEQNKYRFTGLADVNISEVGLVSTGTTSANYYLTTRALIKDSLGTPTSISVKTGETLDIYYKIYKVVDTRDKSFAINMLDGNGGSVPYNVTIRLVGVGDAGYHALTSVMPTQVNYSSTAFALLSALLPITSKPTSATLNNSIAEVLTYTPSTYKKGLKLNFGLNDATSGIKGISVIGSRMYGFPYQIFFESVADKSGIPKTANDTLTIPFEISWGRFEGTL